MQILCEGRASCGIICVQQRALGASVAALGLSNKAVYEDDVLNGPSAEPTGSVAIYTEVSCPLYMMSCSALCLLSDVSGSPSEAPQPAEHTVGTRCTGVK